MTPWRPDSVLDRLTEALEAEILATPDAEVHGLVRDAMSQASLRALRAHVMGAIEAAEKRANLPPQRLPSHMLRRS